MSERIEQIERKLRRARKYLDALENELREFDKNGTRVERQNVIRSPNEIAFSFAMTLRFNRPLDPEWEITVGEVAFQARSSLDQLVTAAVVANGGDASTHRGAFPILIDGDEYFGTKSAKKSIRDRLLTGVPADVAKVIDDLQPFNATDPTKHPLYVINAVCNNDKHRDGQPSLVQTRAASLTVKIPATQTIVVFGHDNIPPGHAGIRECKDGDDLMAFFTPEQIGAIADELARGGHLEDDNLELMSVSVVTGVCFGTKNVFSAQLREALAYIETDVLGRIVPLIT
ncbi:hypothetical protein [Rhodococcus sp. NPDC055024]